MASHTDEENDQHAAAGRPDDERGGSGDGGDELVFIRTFPDSLAAHIARAALDAHGIPAMVAGDDAGGMQPALTFTRGVRLAVRHADAVRALRILDLD